MLIHDAIFSGFHTRCHPRLLRMGTMLAPATLCINYLNAYREPRAHEIIKNKPCFIYRCGRKKTKTHNLDFFFFVLLNQMK